MLNWEPKHFERDDLEPPVSREFCASVYHFSSNMIINFRTHVGPRRSMAERYVDGAVAEPADFKRRAGVGDGFIAYGLSRTVIDLLARLLDDRENCHELAALLKLTA